VPPSAAAGPLPRFFGRLLARVRRASDAVRRGLVLALLVVVYALVLPWFALGLRLRGRRATGWRGRRDPGVASIERLRSPF
jgi:hypothetical protein